MSRKQICGLKLKSCTFLQRIFL